MNKQYLNIKEAIEFSGLSRTSIYNALRKGELAARKAGRRTLIPASELQRFLDNLPTYERAI